MSQHFVVRVRKDGKITIPKEIREYMNINEGVLVEVDLKLAMWWDMLNWDKMIQTWDMLPDEIKDLIRKAGKAPKSDTMILG